MKRGMNKNKSITLMFSVLISDIIWMMQILSCLILKMLFTPLVFTLFCLKLISGNYAGIQIQKGGSEFGTDCIVHQI